MQDCFRKICNIAFIFRGLPYDFLPSARTCWLSVHNFIPQTCKIYPQVWWFVWFELAKCEFYTVIFHFGYRSNGEFPGDGRGILGVCLLAGFRTIHPLLLFTSFCKIVGTGLRMVRCTASNSYKRTVEVANAN